MHGTGCGINLIKQQQREVLQQKLLRDEAVEEIKILKEANTQLLVTASKGERAMQDAQQIKQVEPLDQVNSASGSVHK